MAWDNTVQLSLTGAQTVTTDVLLVDTDFQIRWGAQSDGGVTLVGQNNNNTANLDYSLNWPYYCYFVLQG